MTTFRPSNGHEGDMFMERVCSGCINEPDGCGSWCDILGRSMAFEKDDPRYPVEWQGEFDDPRTWVCTAKEVVP